MYAGDGRNSICFSQFSENQFETAFLTLMKGVSVCTNSPLVYVITLTQALPTTKQSGHTHSMLSNVTGHVKQLWDKMVTR